MRRLKASRGFTLLELIVVLAIGVTMYALLLNGPFGKVSAGDLKAAAREVASVLRRQVRLGAVAPRRAELALADLAAAPVARAPHQPLLGRCWELRDNLTIYDTTYVALAEALRVDFLTGDLRLANAIGPRCPIEVFRPKR